MTVAGRFLIKICGITSPDDAKLAIHAGADAIGVNFWPGSKRFVDEETFGEIVAAIPAGILKFGVFVDAPADEIARRVESFGLDKVQLHGRERAQDHAALPRELLVRAVRVRDEATFANEASWDPSLWLYDAFAPGYGGSGIQAPWPLIAEFGRRPFLLAGGLTPENVGTAIAAVRPDGVDVASGVEADGQPPGKKDESKLKAFITAARAAARTL